MATIVEAIGTKAKSYFKREGIDDTIVDPTAIPSPEVVFPVLRKVFLVLSVFFANAAYAVYSEGSLLVAMVFGSHTTYIVIYLFFPFIMDGNVLLMCICSYVAPSITTRVGIESGYLSVALSIISVGFFCVWIAMKWAGAFVVFYCSVLVCFLEILSAMILTDSSSWFYMWAGLASFMTYVTLYTEVVIQKILIGNTNYVNLAASLFTDFIYVYYRFGKAMLAGNRGNEEE